MSPICLVRLTSMLVWSVELDHQRERFHLAGGGVGKQPLAFGPLPLAGGVVESGGEGIVALGPAGDAGTVPVAPDRPQARGATEVAAAGGEAVDQQVEPAGVCTVPGRRPDLPCHRVEPAVRTATALDWTQLDRPVLQNTVLSGQFLDGLDVAAGERDQQHHQRSQIGRSEEQLARPRSAFDPLQASVAAKARNLARRRHGIEGSPVCPVSSLRFVWGRAEPV